MAFVTKSVELLMARSVSGASFLGLNLNLVNSIVLRNSSTSNSSLPQGILDFFQS
jgi:hypothetical protein